MDSLYQLLKEYTEIYKMLLELEYDKYEAVIKDDVITLDNIVSQEEVCYLQMKGIEHKRERLLNSLDLSGKTLKEIIDAAENESKINLQEQFEELNNTIKDIVKIQKEKENLLNIINKENFNKINNIKKI